MAIVETILKAVGLQRFTEAIPSPLGTSIDPDEHLYRSLTQSSRDVSPVTQDRVLQLAGYLFETNPLARRICELTKDFVVGDGFTVSSPVPEIDDVLSAMWNDPITNLAQTQHLKALEVGLMGEQVWPVFVNEVTGHVRLGVIDPLNIERVLHDPDNAAIPIGVQMKKSLTTQPITYRIIYSQPDSELFSEATQSLREGMMGGECFYFTVNKLTGCTRGRSDLLSLIDWLDGYDRYLFDTMERSGLINAFVWDVTLTGAKEPAINEWLAKNSAPPKPGTVRAHNEGEKWTAETPDLKHADTETGSRILKNHILGGAGIPSHWLSDGGDANLATATEMGTPAYRRLTTRQTFVKEMFAQVCEYQITKAIEPAPGKRGPLAGFETVTIEGNKEPIPATEAFTIQASAVSNKDLQRAATVLLTTSQAVNLAVMNKLMKPETAVNLLAVAANDLGVDVNPQEELAPDAETKGLSESEVQRLYREIKEHVSKLAEATR
jgi:hypothetical protein